MEKPVKHHFEHWLPKFLSLFGFGGITLANNVYYKWSKEEIQVRKVAHELVHVDQIRELGVIRFYTNYLWEMFVNILTLGDFMKAYYSLSFEMEAYKKELSIEYLIKAQEALDEA